MKKLFTILAVAAAMVSCAKEDVVSVSRDAAIAFDGIFVENATRADDPSTTTTSIDEFYVWAVIDEAKGIVFDDEKVWKSGDSWTYTETQQWVPGHDYYFSAIAGVRDHIVLNLAAGNGMSLKGLGTATFTNEDGTNDFLYAEYEVKTPEAFTTAPDAVKFQFNHLLSKVKFTFENAFANNNNTIVITDVQMTAPAKATIDLTADEYAWTNHADVVTLDMGHVAAAGRVAAGSSASTDNERLTIPAGADQEYTVTFKIQQWQGDVLASSADKTITINGVELLPGRGYNFKATINEQNVADNPLYDIEFDVECVNDWVEVEVAKANSASDIQSIIDEAVNEAHIVLTGDINLDDLLTRASSSASITIPADKEVVLDLKDFTITGTDNETASFGMFNIQPGAKLTIEGTTGKIQLTANNNRGWNAYSSVISNQRGEFVLNGGTIEHLGGTDMAYAIDNLTNTGAGDAKTTINGGVVKSTYRAVRLFLNSTKALDEVVVNGGTIEGANKSIWVQNANAKVNPGKLVVAENANLYGDVMVSGSNAPELAIELSVAEAALKNDATVIPSNLPVGYDVVVKDGNYVVEYGVEENGDVVSVSNAGGLKWIAQQVNSGADYFAGKTVKLGADIDLKGAEWTPIGSAYKDHGFMGNFNGNGFVIKNLAIKNITPDSDGYVYGGLFGVTEGTDKDNQNYIKNLVIENVDIDLNGHIVAAAIAYPYYTVVENVTVKGDISIKGGDYTAGVLAYTRRCVDAKDIAIEANQGSVIEGAMTVGGVISDIQMNGGLTANYSNFKASGLTVKGVMHVGGISGILSKQILNGATVENVVIVCDDARKGIVSGSLGEDSTLNDVVVSNVTGADYYVGATYKAGSTHTLVVDGVVYEYLANGQIKVDGNLIIANGVILNEAGEYIISNAAGMFWFANEVNVNKNAFSGKTVKLANDIDLENAAWTPVGQTGATTFNGVFDGQNYTISNLNVNSEAQTGANYSSGLFGWVESHTAGHGHLKNVKIKGATINGHHNCGALVGYITQETALVENCHVTGATVTCTKANNDADGDKAGALIGNATVATPVKNCTATNSTVSAGRDAGQVIGAGKEANVTGCSATNVAVSANETSTGNNIRNEVVGRVL